MMENDRLLLPVMNALLAFECAGRVKSFSEAARLMGTSQPSASRHVSNLEAYLGRQLFHRYNNKIALTEDGEKLYRVASMSLENLRQVVSEFQTVHPSSAITIGCTHGFAHLWIMPRFSSLQSLCPRRDIRVVTADFSYVFDAAEIDFWIRFNKKAVQSAPGTHLFDEEVVLVASPALRAKIGSLMTSADPRALKKAPLLHLDDGEEAWVSWRDWFFSHDVDYQPPKETYFFRNYAFTLQAAAEGQGIALAWRGLLGPYLANGWLEVLDFPALKTEGSYSVVHRAPWSTSAESARIISWFREEVARGDSTTPEARSTGKNARS